MISEERKFKLKTAIARRQDDLTVVLENVHDPHNIGAVMRSCEAIGITKMFVLYTKEGSNSSMRYAGRNATSGSKKWVKCKFFNDVDECFHEVRKISSRILATHLDEVGTSVYSLDLLQDTAFLFGNEHDGVSPNTLSKCDGNFIIPMNGMVQSLNVSVACAVTLFETQRQRMIAGQYQREFDSSNGQHVDRYFDYLALTKPQIYDANPDNFRKIIDPDFQK